ncbi:MAG TPA: MmcQ-like protein [Amoebophilaceae bacterium]|nr:MmcQ-like protein [Amoebophilaceae bacterium]
MDIETYRNHCLRNKGVTEEFPFNKSTLVYKVMGKMFTLANIEPFESINLKCSPETALQLREMHEGVTPGYHMNKKHWNTVRTDGNIPDKTICQWIDDSYGLVVDKLSQRDRKWLEQEAQ